MGEGWSPPGGGLPTGVIGQLFYNRGYIPPSNLTPAEQDKLYHVEYSRVSQSQQSQFQGQKYVPISSNMQQTPANQSPLGFVGEQSVAGGWISTPSSNLDLTTQKVVNPNPTPVVAKPQEPNMSYAVNQSPLTYDKTVSEPTLTISKGMGEKFYSNLQQAERGSPFSNIVLLGLGVQQGFVLKAESTVSAFESKGLGAIYEGIINLPNVPGQVASSTVLFLGGLGRGQYFAAGTGLGELTEFAVEAKITSKATEPLLPRVSPLKIENVKYSTPEVRTTVVMQPVANELGFKPTVVSETLPAREISRTPVFQGYSIKLPQVVEAVRERLPSQPFSLKSDYTGTSIVQTVYTPVEYRIGRAQVTTAGGNILFAGNVLEKNGQVVRVLSSEPTPAKLDFKLPTSRLEQARVQIKYEVGVREEPSLTQTGGGSGGGRPVEGGGGGGFTNQLTEFKLKQNEVIKTETESFSFVAFATPTRLSLGNVNTRTFGNTIGTSTKLGLETASGLRSSITQLSGTTTGTQTLSATGVKLSRATAVETSRAVSTGTTTSLATSTATGTKTSLNTLTNLNTENTLSQFGMPIASQGKPFKRERKQFAAQKGKGFKTSNMFRFGLLSATKLENKFGFTSKIKNPKQAQLKAFAKKSRTGEVNLPGVRVKGFRIF